MAAKRVRLGDVQPKDSDERTADELEEKQPEIINNDDDEQGQGATDPEVIVATLKTVEETMAALNETLSSVKTISERQEAIEKQLDDAQEINKEQRKQRVVMHEEETSGDYLFKGLTEKTPEHEVKNILETTFRSPTTSDIIKEWQTRLTEIKILASCLKKRPTELRAWKAYEDFIETTGISKLVHLGGHGGGAHYIPEGWSNDLLQYFYQELEMPMLFEEFVMPQNPFDWKLLGRPKAVRWIERVNAVRGTNDTTFQDPTHGNVRFDAKVMMVPVQITEEFAEDALMSYMDTLVQEVIPGSMAQGMESALINGDTQTAHQDVGATHTTADVETCFDGLRRIALERSATVDVSSSYNFSTFTSVIREGGIYTVKPRDGAWIMSNSAYTQALDFDQIKTLDKTQMPTNTEGAVNMIMGRPVYVSGEYPTNLDDTGIISSTPANNIKTGFLHINRRQFRIGVVRQENVSMEFDARLQTWVIIATCRKDFQAMENRRNGYTPAVSAINISS